MKHDMHSNFHAPPWSGRQISENPRNSQSRKKYLLLDLYHICQIQTQVCTHKHTHRCSLNMNALSVSWLAFIKKLNKSLDQNRCCFISGPCFFPGYIECIKRTTCNTGHFAGNSVNKHKYKTCLEVEPLCQNRLAFSVSFEMYIVNYPDHWVDSITISRLPHTLIKLLRTINK